MVDRSRESVGFRTTETHCPYCALQCGMEVSIEIPETEPPRVQVEARDFPTNRGAMCRKGWTAGELLLSPERLLTPLSRAHKGAELRPCTWQQAIETVVTSIERLQLLAPESVGMFGGGGLTNETAYMFGKFARLVLRTRNIDYNGRFCMAAAAVAMQEAFGLDRGLPFPLADIRDTETIMLVGANPAETMPPLIQHLEAQASGGGKLIVVDPRRTKTAELAHLHLQPAPGTDLALANGLLHVCLSRGWVDEEYLRERTTGFEAVRQQVSQHWPARVERITGVPEPKLELAARWLGEAKSACTLTARGAEQQSHGTETVRAFINLMLALGKVGKPHSGFGTITGQGNGQGGREHGQKADQLPGYRKLSNPVDRAVVAERWGVNESELPVPGPAACELFASISQPGGVRGLLVMGSNPVVSAPNAALVESRLRSLELLVVADSFLSETAQLADVVLPVCHWAEHDGTMTNLEGRLLLRRKALDPPAEVWTDLQILEALSVALGRPGVICAEPAAAFDELCAVSAGGVADYSGMSHQRLRAGEELFWPCAGPGAAGTPRVFEQRFETPDGRARLHPARYRVPDEQPDDDYPYYLTTGRLLAHYQTGSQTRRVPSLIEAEPQPHVEMHPQLAASFGAKDGDALTLTTRTGHAEFKVRCDATMRLDTVFLPFHWGGEGRANTLTSGRVDTASKIPEFKLTAVRIERPNKEEER